jgi:hypothetical protein
VDHQTALIQTMQTFNLKAIQLAHVAALRLQTDPRTVENQIGRLRIGKDCYAATLFAIVGAMPPSARAYWFALMMTSDAPPPGHEPDQPFDILGDDFRP